MNSESQNTQISNINSLPQLNSYLDKADKEFESLYERINRLRKLQSDSKPDLKSEETKKN
jgi:hypothetical protein